MGNRTVDELREAADAAAEKAQKLMAEKDAEVEKIREKYAQAMVDANHEAVEAQRAWLRAHLGRELPDTPAEV